LAIIGTIALALIFFFSGFRFLARWQEFRKEAEKDPQVASRMRKTLWFTIIMMTMGALIAIYTLVSL
jgi:ABC-type Fe3+ transport system permease subunit